MVVLFYQATIFCCIYGISWTIKHFIRHISAFIMRRSKWCQMLSDDVKNDVRNDVELWNRGNKSNRPHIIDIVRNKYNQGAVDGKKRTKRTSGQNGQDSFVLSTLSTKSTKCCICNKSYLLYIDTCLQSCYVISACKRSYSICKVRTPLPEWETGNAMVEALTTWRY